MNILFVCSANRLRSRTAYEHFGELFKNTDLHFDSCGTNLLYVVITRADIWNEAKIITQELVDWADLVVCMDFDHEEYIKKNFPQRRRNRLEVWAIPDIYDYNDPELIRRLNECLWGREWNEKQQAIFPPESIGDLNNPSEQ